jgi:hypothetical protein
MTPADDVVFLLDPHKRSTIPAADVPIERICDLLDYDFPALLRPARAIGGGQETA